MPTPRPQPIHRAGILTLVTVYLVLLLGIPTRLTVHALGSAGAPSLLFGLSCAFIWFLAQLWRTSSESGERRPIRLALVCFLLVVGVSYVFAMMRPIESDEASQANVALLSTLSMTGVLLVAHDGLVRGVDIETIVRRFALAGGLMATLGIAQYVTRQSLVDRIAIPGLTASYESGTNFRNGLIRVAGTATHPIEFGALLTILLPIALHVALHSHGLGRFRRWFPAATIFVALGLSGSRSAYIGLVVVLVVLLLGWPRRLRMVVGPTSVVVLVLMCLALPPLFRSVRNMFVGAKDDPSIASRTDSYAIAVQFVERWPFFGHGLGTFLPKYRVFDNAYLGLLVSVGIVGTIAFVAIPVTAIWLLLRRRRLWIDERSRDLALSLAAGIAAGSVSLAFFDGFGFPMMMGTMLLTLGISGALLAVRGRSQLPPPDWWPPSGRAEPRHASQDPVELPVPRAHGDQSGVLSDGSRAP